MYFKYVGFWSHNLVTWYFYYSDSSPNNNYLCTYSFIHFWLTVLTVTPVYLQSQCACSDMAAICDGPLIHMDLPWLTCTSNAQLNKKSWAVSSADTSLHCPARHAVNNRSREGTCDLIWMEATGLRDVFRCITLCKQTPSMCVMSTRWPSHEHMTEH